MPNGHPVNSRSGRNLFDRPGVDVVKSATQRLARRRILGRIYGVFILLEGLLGFVAFGLVLQLWALETSEIRVKKYGSVYEQIYELETIGFALLAILCLVIVFAGVGFLKRERWAVYCTLVSGLLLLVIFGGMFIVRQYMWREIEESFSRNVPGLIMKLVLVLIVSLPLIIPPIVPSIRESTEPKRRYGSKRPRVG